MNKNGKLSIPIREKNGLDASFYEASACLDSKSG